MSSSNNNNIFAELLTNSRRPSHFSLVDSDSDTDSDNDLSTLPFPQPLSRALFSSPDFSTESFLLTHSQFRTLEDLRAELREWVDKLENEMEGLIEMDWQGYLTLGRGLQGGEQHVKDAERRVKYAEREITAVKERIEQRIREVQSALTEKKKLRQQTDSVRRLLSINSVLQSLEKGLFLLPDELVQLEQDFQTPYSTDRLATLISQYRELTYHISQVPSSHAFLTSLAGRVEKVKQALEKDIRDGMARKRASGDMLGVFEILKGTRETDLKIISSVHR